MMNQVMKYEKQQTKNDNVQFLKNFDYTLYKKLNHLLTLSNQKSHFRPEQLLALANNDIVSSNKATEQYVLYDFKLELSDNHIHTRQYLDDIDYNAPITSFINANDVLVYADLAQERAITGMDVYNVLANLLYCKVALY